MQIDVTMKTPDALEDAITEHIKSEFGDPEQETDDLKAEELRDDNNEKVAKFKKFAEQFFRYGEYITVRLDDETGTVTVLKN